MGTETAEAAGSRWNRNLFVMVDPLPAIIQSFSQKLPEAAFVEKSYSLISARCLLGLAPSGETLTEVLTKKFNGKTPLPHLALRLLSGSFPTQIFAWIQAGMLKIGAKPTTPMALALGEEG